MQVGDFGSPEAMTSDAVACHAAGQPPSHALPPEIDTADEPLSSSGEQTSSDGDGGATAGAPAAPGTSRHAFEGKLRTSDSGSEDVEEEEDDDTPLAARITPTSASAPSHAARPRPPPRPPGTNATEVRVDVVCAGLRGTLVVPPRFTSATVRVLHEGSLISPLRFEELAGKARRDMHAAALCDSCARVLPMCALADARRAVSPARPCFARQQGTQKRWRSTLRVVTPDGGEGASVGTWLSQYEAAEQRPTSVAPPAPSSSATLPATPVAPPAAAKVASADTEALKNAVGDLIDERGMLDAAHAMDFMRIMRACAAPPERAFVTVVLEGVVARSAAGAPVLDALIAADVLPALETFIEAAAAAHEALLLNRLLKLLAALPVTLAALQRCGLGKRANKLQKFSATAGLAGAAAAGAKDVDAAAAALVTKWKAQVSAETAPAPPAKKARVTSASPAPKAVRTLAEDTDMFAGKAKPKPVAPARPTARVGVLPDAEALKLASRAAGSSPRAAAAVASQPVTERLAAERAARDQAAAMAKAHKESMHDQAAVNAVNEALTLVADLYPSGVPPAPQIIHAAPETAVAHRPSCLSHKRRAPPPGDAPSESPASVPTEAAAAAAASDSAAPSAMAPVPASPAAPSLRDRKRKRKSVLWAPDSALLQIRVFTSDKAQAGEALAYPDPATAGAGALAVDNDLPSGALASRWAELAKQEAAVERRAADAWRHRSHDALKNAPMAPHPPPPVVQTPLMTALHAWACPPLVRFPEWSAGAPAAGEESTERAAQREREALRPPVVYPNLASVPDHPAQGPARSERPADNSNTPWIVHDTQALAEQQQPQQFALPAAAMQQPQGMQGMQMAYSAPPQVQHAPFQMQPHAGMQMMQQPVQQMQAPQQMQMQPQQLMQVSQPLATQPMQMQWSQPMQPAAAQQPPLSAGTGWMMQQPMQAQAPQQPQMQQQQQQQPQQPNIGAGTFPSWLLGGQPMAQQPQPPPLQKQPAPVSLPGSDQLAELVRSLTAPGMDASILQRVLEQANVGATAQQSSVPVMQQSIPPPRPPSGPPPTQVASIGGWQLTPQQPVQQHGGFASIPPPNPPSGPPPQSAFTATQPLQQVASAGTHRGNGVPCRYFKSRSGCHNGDACRFAHMR